MVKFRLTLKERKEKVNDDVFMALKNMNFHDEIRFPRKPELYRMLDRIIKQTA